MHITTELLTALELSVKGEEVNLSDVMDVCLQAFPELFQNHASDVDGDDNNANFNLVNAVQKDHHSSQLLRLGLLNILIVQR